MVLERRVRLWVQAGLIDEGQATRIVAFERQGERPWLLYAFGALGALAVAIGLLAVVAANWDHIPGGLKVANALVTVAACGVGLFYLRRRGSSRALEVLLAVFYGLVLSTIALIGQVYQLGGATHHALLAWSALTLPMMTLGRSPYLAVLWTFGLQWTIGTWCVWLIDSPIDRSGLALAITGAVPWMWLLVGSSSWLERRRPQYATLFRSVGITEILLCATIGTHAFYFRTSQESWNELWLGLATVTVVTGLLGWRWSSHPQARTITGWLGLNALFTYVPALVSAGEPSFLAALCFLVLWIATAVAAHRLGALGLLNLATGVIGVRLLVVYFEVFGSLLDTGLGLIGGGLLTLFLVWLWWRKRRDFAAQLREEGSS
jgi:uncharacterized membrane protein